MGTGADLAAGLAERGPTITLIDRNDSSVTQRKIEEADGRCASFIADVTPEEQISELAYNIRDVFEHINMLVKDASISIVRPFNGTGTDLWQRMSMPRRGT
ncbi:SDR family NAD(P)-dependent oxidoreductase [Nocardia sp. NEAU-G5]|uniref:SDR family NAD(P)-dependent oxidoreductase n=2 Tax=Nocardia albiluteola TaxID=2842303 RepID=A0ABS6B2I5_9NOCA|nr:SDR family NAD(P)-dependent oxidoreductase [Nocardia albiluteola]